MAGEGKQQSGLQVLKNLNAAVTTTKLYPPHFPQVTSAVENAYELISGYLTNYGTLSFSLIDGEPHLGGLPVNQRTLGKMPGEEVFQQLKLLQLNHFVLAGECDESTFKTLITFFTTSPQLINKEGGGRSFVMNMGLNDIFPERYDAEVPAEREDSFGQTLVELKKEGRARGEDIRTVLSEIDAETEVGEKMLSALAAHTAKPGGIEDLVTAAVAELFKGITRCGQVTFPHAFGFLLRNVERIIEQENRDQIVAATAASFTQYCDEFGLHILLSQRYPEGFGAELHSRLLTTLGKRFDGVVELIRQERKIVEDDSGSASEQYTYVSAALDALLATDKGKQFLLREKAKNTLQAGEKERQAKRIQAGIKAILKGDVTSLKNKEIVGSLPATIESLISKGKDKAAATIVTNITTELLKSDDRSHDLLGECLGNIAESLVNTEKWDWLEKLSVPLLAWIKEGDRGDEVLENIIAILLKLQKYYWKNGKDEQADKILKLFYAIRTGKLEKKQEVVAIIGRLQDLSVERAPLPALLQRSVENPNELIDRRLAMQGPFVARFLLNRLLESADTAERLKILELLRRMKFFLPSLLLEKLATPMPWHGKRNLLKLLSETGREEHARKVIDYLNHEDIRVQQEALNCICILSGEDRKENLLEALSFASGPMMEQVVRALTPSTDEEVIRIIAEMLADWVHYPDEIRDSLLVRIAKFLGKTVSSTAENALEEFLQLENRSRSRMIGDEVWLAAKKALRQIKTVKRERSRKQILESRKKLEDVTEDVTQVNKGKRRSEFAEETQIEALVADGEVHQAKEMLVELIGKAAERERFEEAENLREWLVEIAPNALSDIISTAEVIEEAKRIGINNDYLQIWSGLQDNLTSEEFSALYYAMEHRSISEEEVLVNQGDMRPALFFVNQGKVKLYCGEKGREALLKVVRQGEVFGAESFFDASVWTVNAAALARAEISVLPQDKIRNWAAEHPSLEFKLLDFSQKFKGLTVPMNDPRNNRREHPRYKIQANVPITASVKGDDEEVLRMKGELADISLKGLSFLVRITQKKNARILLGRKLSLQLSCTGAPGNILQINGEIVAVRSLYTVENEFSVHVRFTCLLEKKEIEGVLEAGENRI